jgi:hypothetical protein
VPLRQHAVLSTLSSFNPPPLLKSRNQDSLNILNIRLTIAILDNSRPLAITRYLKYRGKKANSHPIPSQGKKKPINPLRIIHQRRGNPSQTTPSPALYKPRGWMMGVVGCLAKSTDSRSQTCQRHLSLRYLTVRYSTVCTGRTLGDPCLDYIASELRMALG